MIILKSSKEIMLMKAAGLITARALEAAGKAVRPGISTLELDRIAHDEIIRLGATPSCLGYEGFPNSACISVNNKVIHGIPSKSEKLKEGDIVSIDLCAYIGGFHGDSAATFPVGEISDEARKLIEATEASMWKGIDAAQSGNKIGDIGWAVQEYVEARGYSVVRDFTGHGIGASMHEEPSVPNYGRPGRGVKLRPGMVITIEPMINMGSDEIEILDDEWTVVTSDGKLSAHFEHTLAITENGPVILTALS